MITFVFNKAGNLDQLPYFVLSNPHVRNSNSRNIGLRLEVGVRVYNIMEINLTLTLTLTINRTFFWHPKTTLTHLSLVCK